MNIYERRISLVCSPYHKFSGKESLTSSQDFKHSVLESDKLRSLPAEQRIPLLHLKQDVPTRWNSTVIMIERLIEMKNVLTEALTALSRVADLLDEMEWNILLDCSQLLNPLKEVTEQLSGENYSTISMVIPLIKCMVHVIEQQLPTTAVGILLQSKLLTTVEKRFSLARNKIAAISTFLDPRFKHVPFDGLNDVKQWIQEEIAQDIQKNSPSTSRKSKTTC
ncbi:hypothetical protein QE152_g7943 [Popillia japonica]|uniref:Uncharacterized protein n=1 Tax=Popillia japonica TaxID=7064 RepID=A0AAW1MDF5_POPJA